MTPGTTKIGGVEVYCQLVGLKEVRKGREVIKRQYTVSVADGHIFTVDNFEPEGGNR